MKSLQDFANEIAQAHWDRPQIIKTKNLTIFKTELLNFRKSTPEQSKEWNDRYLYGKWDIPESEP